jgi:hypothetical protein
MDNTKENIEPSASNKVVEESEKTPDKDITGRAQDLSGLFRLAHTLSTQNSAGMAGFRIPRRPSPTFASPLERLDPQRADWDWKAPDKSKPKERTVHDMSESDEGNEDFLGDVEGLASFEHPKAREARRAAKKAKKAKKRKRQVSSSSSSEEEETYRQKRRQKKKARKAKKRRRYESSSSSSSSTSDVDSPDESPMLVPTPEPIQSEVPDSAALIKMLKDNLPEGMSLDQAVAKVGLVDSIFQKVTDAELKEVGPALDVGVTRVMNSLWNNKCKVIADVFTKYLRPANLEIYKVDINKEIELGLAADLKAKDKRLRAVQSSIAAAVHAQGKMLQDLQNLDTKTGPELSTAVVRVVTTQLDSIKLLSHGNASLNDVRKDILKPGLAYKYRALAKDGAVTKDNLFGEKLTESAKVLDKAVSYTSNYKGKGGYRKGGFGKGKVWPENRRDNYTPSSYRKKSHHNSQHRGGDNYQASKSQTLVSSDNVDWPISIINVENSNVENSNVENNIAFCRSRPRQGQQGVQGKEEVEKTVGPQINEVCFKPVTFGKWPSFKAGRLSDRLHIWQGLTSDYIILDHIKGFRIPFEEFPTQQHVPQPIRFSGQEKGFIQNKLNEMLLAGIVTRCEPCDDQIISNIFLVPKKTPGQFRMILNLKNLNYDVEYAHFKMDTLYSALKLVTRNCYMLSLDIKDAYYSVNVHKDDRKYLRFVFENKLYQFTCLPQGLACAPRVFTKLLKIPLSVLRKDYGIDISAFIDDLFTVDDSHIEANKAVAG